MSKLPDGLNGFGILSDGHQFIRVDILVINFPLKFIGILNPYKCLTIRYLCESKFTATNTLSNWIITTILFKLV